MIRSLTSIFRITPRVSKHLVPASLPFFHVNPRTYSDDSKKKFISLETTNQEDESVIEIYDVSVEHQFDEDPEFEYFNQSPAEYNYPFMSTGRSTNGVFDLPEIVQFLRAERFFDIVAIRSPNIASCSDFIVIATANSAKHIARTSSILQKLFKMKRNLTDAMPLFDGIEGKSDWAAVDLGNIILHMFATKVCRERYDLESLWGVGTEFDLKAQGLDDSTGKSDQFPLLSLTQADWERIVAEVAADESTSKSTCEGK
ncbi:hypothetical protein Aperf_G00000045309 [Anoplocephala perfoliata]